MRIDSLMQELALQAQQGQSATREPRDPTHAFYDNASAARVQTETYMIKALRTKFPQMKVTSIALTGVVTLLDFANATGQASYKPLSDDDPLSAPFTTKQYIPPARRIDGPTAGNIAEKLNFGKFEYSFKGTTYLLFIVSGRDGHVFSPGITLQLLVHAPALQVEATLKELILATGKWATVLHNEIWVYDQSFWRKDAGLWESIQKSHWRDVILDEDQKKTIQDDARRFFDSRERYEKLRVPWKRGVIYYGPPGNGKTVSIKALSHELYARKDPVPTLYVKSFTSYAGPQYAIKVIFEKARAEAPCLLVFEDLDSLVTDNVRSYFLNEVDGLTTNEGVMMIGSTNHLERLDPGISKRPSRFDRKFPFPKPDFDQRTAYCEYWRGKLSDNKEIDFPKELSPEIARITDKFSFAYLQEAFVASLLAIAFEDETEKCEECRSRGGLEDLVLWKEIQKQVKILREEL